MGIKDSLLHKRPPTTACLQQSAHSKPNGLPIAKTCCPTRTLSESPSWTDLRDACTQWNTCSNLQQQAVLLHGCFLGM